MTDPGLTDLIAAHKIQLFGVDGPHYQAETEYDGCLCGWQGAEEDHPAHVALVVEQHTNGRMAELEARITEAQSLCHDTGRYNAARQKHWNIRVFACDVLAALKGRAALEGEQQ
ncbi:hypothetical protein [Rhodococcus sp. BH5]|uniref:hypothetical protein n=1 Tax=Rhodococcus sp. BH5 TaxID=2871702 RepID=UPI0022CD6504|nr:hypothetical protein [Rhodococcus sp. BH5]MCZ9631337.1 hypothetical protein [Rhodococcus sp. BH5]